MMTSPNKNHFVKYSGLLIAALIIAVAVFLHHYIPDGIYSDTNSSQVISIPEESRLTTQKNNTHEYGEIIYGYSGNGIPLIAHKFTNKESDRKILCVFAIHGFEDAFYRDGQALVDIASNIVEHYQQDSRSLGSYDLVIVAEANPDGVRQGWTCNGPGRCQLSQGIDMNMDFDYNFRVRTNSRNQTGPKPFSSPEAAALRDLVEKENPDIVIDFQGWINCAAGDPILADIFCRHLGLVHKSVQEAVYDGFFIGWAAQGSQAVLVEYPDPFTGTGDYKGKSDQQYDYTSAGFHDLGYTENTLHALEEIIEKQL